MTIQRFSKPIYVTQPSLPPLEEYVELLQGIWDRGILTHNGPIVQRLEKELSKKLGIENFVSVTNGTIAIQLAIKALALKGEIITTAFGWVATVSAIKWEGCTPIFCDIDPGTLNIDTAKIESLITENTVAIIPVHVFGNPCDVVELERIAIKYNLKLIYDAAHALGTTLDGSSILDFGDISATSLHGTKLLNSAEGGGCITLNPKLNDKLKRIRFFGHNDNKDIVEDGLNGKMTEVHAALGLANLKYFDEVLEDRKNKYFIYYNNLKSNKNISFQELNGDGCNYSYFPIIFKSEKELLRVERLLNEQNVFPRRYFYPSLNTLTDIVEYQNTPISEKISRRILCLPLYKNLKIEEIASISNIINI
jgi:dTDP-4-amino-4,6-dideoxygalactose transaminase